MFAGGGITATSSAGMMTIFRSITGTGRSLRRAELVFSGRDDFSASRGNARTVHIL